MIYYWIHVFLLEKINENRKKTADHNILNRQKPIRSYSKDITAKIS